VQLPAARDVDGARVRRGLLPAHAEHDALGEREPDLVVVVELRVPLEMLERRVTRVSEAGCIERQPVPHSGAHVALRAELRARLCEREIDVEEDGPDDHASSSSQRTTCTCGST